MVLGCAIDRLDMEQTLPRCQAIVERGVFAQQVSINAANLFALGHDPDLREVVSRCELVNADGQAVVWASRLPCPERGAGRSARAAIGGTSARADAPQMQHRGHRRPAASLDPDVAFAQEGYDVGRTYYTSPRHLKRLPVTGE